MKHPFFRQHQLADNPEPSGGFSLTELLVAGVIGVIVLAAVGTSVVTILRANKEAEARTQRRIDLSRAFDFITNETRMARAINQTDTTISNGTSVTVEDVVASSGLDLTDLGAYETVVLYLEIPISADIPDTCPAGGPNAGSPPPEPADYDRVVYDIRPNATTWLGPRAIYRYGRVPESDGTINPCSTPISSDILVDAIAAINISPTPTCNDPAVLSGAGGFYACVNGRQVNLHLQSKVSNIEAHGLNSAVSSRLVREVIPVLSGERSPGTDTMDLAWTWSGPNAGITFVLTRTVDDEQTEIYSGPDLATSNDLTGDAGDINCYQVTATNGIFTTPPSDPVCETK